MLLHDLAHKPILRTFTALISGMLNICTLLPDDSEDCSDKADAQADQSLHWAHKPQCWFYHGAAHYSRHPFNDGMSDF